MTTSKLSSEFIRRNSDYFAALFRNEKSRLMIIDNEYRVQALNRQAAEWFEKIYDIKISEGDIFFNVIPPARKSDFEPEILKAFSGEEVCVKKCIQPVRDGNSHNYDFTFSPICTENAEVIGVLIGLVRETGNNLNNDLVISKEDIFHTLVQTSSDIITILSADGNILYRSASFEKVFGYSINELIGTSVFNRIHPDDQGQVMKVFRQLLTMPPNQNLSVECRYLHKNGAWVYIECVGCNQLSNPIVNGIIVNTRDVSSRKQAEAEKEKLVDQLVQSQKMQAIGSMASGIAHDFNNILSGILCYIELLKLEIPIESAHLRHLSKIENATQRAVLIVKQILAFSRQKKGVTRRVSLHTVVTEVKNLILPTIDKRILIVNNVPYDLPEIDGDEIQIEQVVLNLLINSIDAIKETLEKKEKGQVLFEGKVEEAVSIKGIPLEEMMSKEYVHITVKDTGVGISPEVRTKVFDPFFTTKPEGHGTGLGLALAYNVIKSHNAFIALDSELGEGTSVHLYFPMAKSNHQRIVMQKYNSVNLGGKETILIVEDEDLIRDAVAEYMTGLGYTVLKAADGKEALELFSDKKNEISLVVLDMNLPAITGSTVLEKLKFLSPDIAIIIMSASDNYDVQKLGAKDCILKPCTPYQVALKMREVLNQKRENYLIHQH